MLTGYEHLLFVIRNVEVLILSLKLEMSLNNEIIFTGFLLLLINYMDICTILIQVNLDTRRHPFHNHEKCNRKMFSLEVNTEPYRMPIVDFYGKLNRTLWLRRMIYQTLKHYIIN